MSEYRNDIVGLNVENPMVGESIGESIGFDATSNVWGIPMIAWIFIGSIVFIGFAIKGKKKSS